VSCPCSSSGRRKRRRRRIKKQEVEEFFFSLLHAIVVKFTDIDRSAVLLSAELPFVVVAIVVRCSCCPLLSTVHCRPPSVVVHHPLSSTVHCHRRPSQLLSVVCRHRRLLQLLSVVRRRLSPFVKVPSLSVKVPLLSVKVPLSFVKVPLSSIKIPSLFVKVLSLSVKVPSLSIRGSVVVHRSLVRCPFGFVRFCLSGSVCPAPSIHQRPSIAVRPSPFIFVDAPYFSNHMYYIHTYLIPFHYGCI